MSKRSITLATLLFGLSACADQNETINAADNTNAAMGEADLARLVADADDAKAVFIGEITAIDDRLSEPDANGRVVPFHFVTWSVETSTRGVEAGQSWTGRFAGGALPDGRTLWVSEVPDFQVGQRALILANDGDAGSCALIGCREGMVLIGDGGLDPRAADDLLAALDDGRTSFARSADPNTPFQFSTHPRQDDAGLRAAQARSERALSRPMHPEAAPSPADLAEIAAIEANGGDPVLPR